MVLNKHPMTSFKRENPAGTLLAYLLAGRLDRKERRKIDSVSFIGSMRFGEAAVCLVQVSMGDGAQK